MNETLQQALVAILENAVGATDKAITFLSSEIPIVVQQLLYWKFAQSFIMFLMGIGLIAAVAIGNWKAYKHYKSIVPKGDYCSKRASFGYAWTMLGGCVGMIATLIAILLLNITWLQILIAPKIYLIEYAAKLIKG